MPFGIISEFITETIVPAVTDYVVPAVTDSFVPAVVDVGKDIIKGLVGAPQKKLSAATQAQNEQLLASRSSVGLLNELVQTQKQSLTVPMKKPFIDPPARKPPPVSTKDMRVNSSKVLAKNLAQKAVGTEQTNALKVLRGLQDQIRRQQQNQNTYTV